MAQLRATDLLGCNSIPDFIPTGSVFLCFQSAAPTSWTRITTHNNKAIRVVSGAGGGFGGNIQFTTAFTSRTPTGTVTVNNAATTLLTSEIPSHTHGGPPSGQDNNCVSGSGAGRGWAANGGFSGVTSLNMTNTGGGGSHTHANTASFSGNTLDFNVQYIDIILCSKN